MEFFLYFMNLRYSERQNKWDRTFLPSNTDQDKK